jgi:hypothetical protein
MVDVPEIELLLAVILQAIRDAQGPHYVNATEILDGKSTRVKKKNYLKEEAKSWLLDENSTFSLFLAHITMLDKKDIKLRIAELLKSRKLHRTKITTSKWEGNNKLSKKKRQG